MELSNEMKTCRQCGATFHWLEEFPGCICLACHAKKYENATAEELYGQIMDGFGGTPEAGR